jgi:type IV secretion system protein VirB6
MIVGGFFTGGLGIIFVIAAFFFAFLLIAVTIRALHIFLLSTTAVIILMYVSPITITLAMFSKTKAIFESWWKQILGFTLQPMILFAYLGILITFFDKVIIGDAHFKGEGKQSPKQIVCEGEAQDTSIYCIFRVAQIKTFTGLEPIGIGIPVLKSMNQTKLKTIMTASLLMFILMSFLDQISQFAQALVGGSILSSDWKVSATGMAKTAYGAMSAIQKRGMGAIKKGSTAIGKSLGSRARGGINTIGNKGKSTDRPATSSTRPGDLESGGAAENPNSSSAKASKTTTTPSAKDSETTSTSGDET